jgi:hypothetical protein
MKNFITASIFKPNSKIALWLILIAPITLLPQSPWQIRVKLKVSSNGNIIQHADETRFLWIVDMGWGMFQQITHKEVDQYQDHSEPFGVNESCIMAPPAGW